MRDSFVFYRSFIQAIEDQPADDFKKIIMSAAAYALDGIEPELSDSAIKMALSFMKPLLDSNNARWEETRNKRAENGRKGGLATQANARIAKANQANQAVNVNVNVNDNVDVANQPTTTNYLHIQETAKAQGFFISDKQAQKFQCLDPTWLSGDYNFLVFAAEKVRDNSEKDQGDWERIFAMSWGYENLVREFPEWRERKIAEAVTKEERRKQEAAADAERERVEQARNSRPETCARCGASLAVDGARGNCPACECVIFFDEVSGRWEFQEPFSLKDGFENMIKQERRDEQRKIPSLRYEQKRSLIFFRLKKEGISDEEANQKATEEADRYFEIMGA